MTSQLYPPNMHAITKEGYDPSIKGYRSEVVTQSLLTTLLDPLAFLPTLTAWTWELNTCTAMFISTTTLHATDSATSIYSVPQHKVKHTMDEKHSKTGGGMLKLTGGKPMLSVNSATAKQTSSIIEVADNEVCLHINLF